MQSLSLSGIAATVFPLGSIRIDDTGGIAWQPLLSSTKLTQILIERGSRGGIAVDR